jgi:glycine hydroxymethyltransferase
MGVDEMARIAEWMDGVVSNPADDDLIARTRAEVVELCRTFPAPGISVTD